MKLFIFTFHRAFVFLLLMPSIATPQTTWYVDADASAANDCTSWADACTELQTALGLALAGDQVWVAAGTYKPDEGGRQTPGDRAATFPLKTGVVLYGGFDGTETSLAERAGLFDLTILNGDLAGDDGPDFANYGDNSVHVVTTNNTGTSFSAILDGFLIRGGNADQPDEIGSIGGGILIYDGDSAVIRNCVLRDNKAIQPSRTGGSGGAVALGYSSSAQITDCHFESNFSAYGGAVYERCPSQGCPPGIGASAIILSCVFIDNSATVAGGAMRLDPDSMTSVTSCLFSENSAAEGGAISNHMGNTLNLRDCTFTVNSATGAYPKGGGAIFGDCDSTSTIVNCKFVGNDSTGDGGAIMLFTGGDATVINSLFSGNSSQYHGGGINVRAGSCTTDCTVTNCTLSGNVAQGNGGGDGGGIHNGDGTLTLRNCILWGNKLGIQPKQIHVTRGVADVAFSALEGGTGAITFSNNLDCFEGPGDCDGGVLGMCVLAGPGNLADDPAFVDPDGMDGMAGTLDDDLHLSGVSLCIDSGNNQAVPPDTVDLDDDSNTIESTPLDLDGGPRFYCPQEPCGSQATVDMGAYEFADCNGNGIPDGIDLADCMGSASCGDCNGNAILDECDIAGSASTDCDSNGIPDECDIAACDLAAPAGPPDCSDMAGPNCADCNLNGVPDCCDIASMISADADMDGVPDECIDFFGGCGAGNVQWSCAQNWDGDVVPNNNGSSVVLDGDNVVGGADVVELDIDVAIDSLLMIDGATLNITGGDLTVAQAGGILNEGVLQIANGQEISILAGDLTLQSGGVYQAVGPAKSASGQLNANNVLIGNGSCSGAGTMALTGGMVAFLNGNLLLEGDDGDDPGKCEPELAVHNDADASAVNLVLQGGVSVAYTSSEPLTLSGDFINQSTSPEEFDWLNGVIEFVSDGGPGPLLEDHFLEVAAVDLGAAPPLATGDELFLIGGITVASGNRLTVQNQVAPVGRAQSSCSEALYVSTLHIDNGAKLVAENVRIYYETLMEDGTTTLVGCGDLLEFVPPVCTLAAECGDADDDGKRDDACMWYSCSAGACDSLPRGFGNGGQYGQADLGSPAGPGACNVDGVADGNDRFHALNCFSNANFGAPGDYPCEPDSPNTLNVDAGSSASCVLDGVCDGNDAFHALNSFANANFGVPGGYPCTCTGPAPAGGTGTGTHLTDEVDSLDGNASQVPRVFPQEHTGLALRAPRQAGPGELVHVDVHLTLRLTAVRGYQLHLSAAGGTRGALELVDIFIDAARGDYAFSGVPDVWTAFNRSTGQMLAGMDAPDGVPVSAGAYLATFTYRVPKNASGTFVVEVRAGDRGPTTQDRTFLFGSYARPIGVEQVMPVRVAVDGSRRTHTP